jgi:hypothetical protein
VPWIDVGRHTFDLCKVQLITRGVRVEGHPDEPALTVTLKSGVTVDLLGVDATDFGVMFAEYRASRGINRSPPDRPPEEAGPLVIVGQSESDREPGVPYPTPPGSSRGSNRSELPQSTPSRAP